MNSINESLRNSCEPQENFPTASRSFAQVAQRLIASENGLRERQTKSQNDPRINDQISFSDLRSQLQTMQQQIQARMGLMMRRQDHYPSAKVSSSRLGQN